MNSNDCKICNKRTAIVLCSNCKETNCGSAFGCCFTFPNTEETVIVVCHTCYNDITRKLQPYKQYISEKIQIIKKIVKKRQQIGSMS